MNSKIGKMLREQRLEVVEDRSNASLRKSVIHTGYYRGSTRATRPAIGLPARVHGVGQTSVAQTGQGDRESPQDVGAPEDLR